MATRSRIRAWRIPWTEEPGRMYRVAKSRRRLKQLCTEENSISTSRSSLTTLQGVQIHRSHLSQKSLPESISSDINDSNNYP